MWASALRIIGLVGTSLFVFLFASAPSFPTPDKILVFLTLTAMMYGQAREVLKRFVPFVALLLVYESFRGLVPGLNTRVNFTFMPIADKLMFFGELPTAVLQRWWWHGNVMWYDFVFYGAYTLHFVLPFALAVLVWKTREKQYWNIVTGFLVLSFAGFLTYLAFPAAPPWMATERGVIEPIVRVSSYVWGALGVQDFPTIYNKISPNPVAAVPSLHAAYSMLFVIYVTRLFQTRWRYLTWIYPLLIWVGTTYMGEHYVIDIVLGIIYAIASYFAAPHVVVFIQKTYKKILDRF